MLTKIFFSIIFIFVIVQPIKGRKYNFANYKKLDEPKKIIELDSVVLNKFSIYFLSDIELVNDYLVVSDIKSEKMIKIIDLKSGELLKSFGLRGQGPDEFISVAEIISDPKDKKLFWIFDITTHILKCFNINKIFKNIFTPEKIVRISQKTGFPFHLTITPDEKMIGTGYFF
jgi:hypothetical protein